MVSDSRPRTHGLGPTVSDTRSRARGLGHVMLLCHGTRSLERQVPPHQGGTSYSYYLQRHITSILRPPASSQPKLALAVSDRFRVCLHAFYGSAFCRRPSSLRRDRGTCIKCVPGHPRMLVLEVSDRHHTEPSHGTGAAPRTAATNSVCARSPPL